MQHRPQWVSAEQAAELVFSGATVASAGFVGVGHAEAVTRALEQRFVATDSPRDLRLIYSAGQGDRGSRGVNHFGHPGMTTRIIGGHWRSAPKLAKLATDNLAQAWNLPQGVITHLYRAIAAKTPGVITRIGLNTFVDPAHAGGKLNACTVDDLVERIEIDGEPWLRYKPIPIDFALIRATCADALGNLSCEDEPFHHELLAISQAARNSGGKVIAQVKKRVDHHTHPHLVKVPGILVDYVVEVAPDDIEHHMTFGEAMNLDYVSAAPARIGASASRPIALPTALEASDPANAASQRLAIQRRAALELERQHPTVVNLGVGMPAGVGAIAHAAGVDQYTLTVEAGPIGGTPADGLSFGASRFPQAVVDEPAQFDFYDGGGIDLAMLGMAQFDWQGNVNVSMFGQGEQRLLAGVGGFINITQSSRSLVFLGSFMNRGRSKLLPQVEHLSFNGRYALEQGTRVRYITDLAVFDLVLHQGEPRLRLIELAPHVKLERDVLPFCGPGLLRAPLTQKSL
jgi:propionate CoA-transferase